MSLFPFRHRPAAPHSETQEMILLTLVRAAENATVLDATALAHELNISRAALDPQVRPLIEHKLVDSTASGPLSLTEAGRARALTLLRRHRLAERLMTDILGLDWARAHEEADILEHVVSPEAEQQMVTRLGDPRTCPHGNPIPGLQTDAGRPALKSLDQCAALTEATISRIGLETPAALQHLATLGLLPDVDIEIENKAPFDGPVMVRVGRAHYALGRDLAARIWVRTSS